MEYRDGNSSAGKFIYTGEGEARDIRIRSAARRLPPDYIRVHRTVINRFKNYCFSIQMGWQVVFKGWISVGRARGNERRRKNGGCENGGGGGKGDAEKGEKESGSLAEAFMPKFAQRTRRGSFVIFHEKAL